MIKRRLFLTMLRRLKQSCQENVPADDEFHPNRFGRNEFGNGSHMVNTAALSCLRVHRGGPKSLSKPRKLIFEESASQRT